jgi:hypothetical protein
VTVWHHHQYLSLNRPPPLEAVVRADDEAVSDSGDEAPPLLKCFIDSDDDGGGADK